MLCAKKVVIWSNSRDKIIGSLINQSCWFEAAGLTQQHAYTVNLLAYWAGGEKEPWLLATNLPSFRQTLRAYQRRMWIEEMFGDLKKHGKHPPARFSQTVSFDVSCGLALCQLGNRGSANSQSWSTSSG
jgi:hypothetical protein